MKRVFLLFLGLLVLMANVAYANPPAADKGNIGKAEVAKAVLATDLNSDEAALLEGIFNQIGENYKLEVTPMGDSLEISAETPQQLKRAAILVGDFHRWLGKERPELLGAAETFTLGETEKAEDFVERVPQFDGGFLQKAEINTKSSIRTTKGFAFAKSVLHTLNFRDDDINIDADKCVITVKGHPKQIAKAKNILQNEIKDYYATKGEQFVSGNYVALAIAFVLGVIIYQLAKGTRKSKN